MAFHLINYIDDIFNYKVLEKEKIICEDKKRDFLQISIINILLYEKYDRKV